MTEIDTLQRRRELVMLSAELQQSVQDSAKVAMNTTDEYVRSNPWRAVGISAGIGALIGFLIARR